MPDFLELERVSVPLLGNSLAVGAAALLHIAFAGLAVGYMLAAPLAEALGRSRPWYTEAAHTMTRFTLVTYTVSVVLAVIMVELFIGLFPLTNVWLFNQFRYPVALAAAAFLGQLLVLYPYYHYWDALRAWSARAHLLMGVAAAVLMLVWVGVLDGIGSYMLTPVEGAGPWTRLWNPTWVALALHRLAGDFVIAGYALAGYAAWRLGRARPDDRPYYVTLLQAGFLCGVTALLLQPAFGMLYAVAIERAAPDAYLQMIRGPYRPMVYAQFALVGALFLGSHLWLTAAQPQRALPRWTPGITAAAVAGMIAAAGSPDVRRAVSFLLVAFMIWALYRARRTFGPMAGEAGALGRPAVRILSLVLGATALLTYLLMGTIRETARRPDTVRGLISLTDEAGVPAAFREGRMRRSPAGEEAGP